MVLPKRLVIVSKSNPTPEINATGVIHDCRNWINILVDSIGFVY